MGVLLYPTVSNYYNVVHQSNAIVEYAENLAALDNEAMQELWKEAEAYNRDLYRAQCGEELPEDALHNYREILQVADNGMMGYIDIEKINVHLPIYHGTAETVLQKGVGHLEWSSFPVGGENAHAVLTGHSGLPSARLFTDLEKLRPGDCFVLQILGNAMRYEIEDVSTVLPYETESLAIAEGEDLCTLVTCTPYGVNSHRLLLRAHRVENEDSEAGGALKNIEKNAKLSARTPMIGMILLIASGVILLMLMLFGLGKKTKQRRRAEGE